MPFSFLGTLLAHFITTHYELTGTIKVEGKKIRLPRLGPLNLKEHSQVQGKILSATITKEVDRWYVSLTVEREVQDPKPVRGQRVGIDMGLKCFAACSNEDKIYAPKPLAKNLKRLRRASRNHSRKVIGSKNRKKIVTVQIPLLRRGI